jgi:hypothetical protein
MSTLICPRASLALRFRPRRPRVALPIAKPRFVTVTPGVRSLPGPVRRLHLLSGQCRLLCVRARHGRELAHDSPHRAALAATLDRLNRLAFPAPDALLDQYAEALSRFAPRAVEPIYL